MSGYNHANTPERVRAMAAVLPNGRLLAVPDTGAYVQHSAPVQCLPA